MLNFIKLSIRVIPKTLLGIEYKFKAIKSQLKANADKLNRSALPPGAWLYSHS